jgi:hypothetical protein
MKAFGNDKVEAVLHRLDRLALDEALLTAAQILEVVRGLVENLRNVMNGEQALFYLSCTCVKHPSFKTTRPKQTASRRH